MSDERIDPISSAPAFRARLTITWQNDGSLHVDFPLEEIVTLGMLEKGAEVIKAALRARAMPQVLPANGAFPTPPRRLLG